MFSWYYQHGLLTAFVPGLLESLTTPIYIRALFINSEICRAISKPSDKTWSVPNHNASESLQEFLCVDAGRNVDVCNHCSSSNHCKYFNINGHCCDQKPSTFPRFKEIGEEGKQHPGGCPYWCHSICMWQYPVAVNYMRLFIHLIWARTQTESVLQSSETWNRCSWIKWPPFLLILQSVGMSDSWENSIGEQMVSHLLEGLMCTLEIGCFDWCWHVRKLFLRDWSSLILSPLTSLGNMCCFVANGLASWRNQKVSGQLENSWSITMYPLWTTFHRGQHSKRYCRNIWNCLDIELLLLHLQQKHMQPPKVTPSQPISRCSECTTDGVTDWKAATVNL